MIDEGKMIQEIEEAKRSVQPASLQERLLDIFLLYIKKQRTLDIQEQYFLLLQRSMMRMRKILLLAVEKGIVQKISEEKGYESSTAVFTDIWDMI